MKELKKALILPKPHPLTNFEIQHYYKNEPKFNAVYSRDNSPNKIKKLDEYADTGTNWIGLYAQDNEVIYFDSFGVEYIPKQIKKFTKQKKHQNKHI